MLEIALIVFGITAVIGISLGLYLTNVCTRVTDEEEYDAKILEDINKDFRR